jgi:lipid A disaccharide synthetase
VPELIQNDFTAAKIVEHIAPLLPDGPPRQSMMQELEGIRIALRPRAEAGTGDAKSAIERLASIVLDQVSQQPS